MDKEFSNLAAYSKSSHSPRGISSKTRAFLYVFIFILLIGGAIFAGNYFLSSRQEEEKSQAALVTSEPTPTATPTPQESVTPTENPTPTEKVTPTVAAKLRIEVLNGSGQQGMASKMASFLKSKGYSITATGNADAFDYTQSVIQIKKSKNQFTAQLKKDLSASYSVDPTVQTLAESSTADAIVIVGAE